MKQLICSGALCVLIGALTPRLSVAQANEPFIGEIQTFAFNFCPSGWAALDGQLLPINQNVAVFSLIGTTYGGDGVTTFALPKWGPIYAVNGGALHPCIALQGVYPSQN